jgi:hypothetical protein
MAFGFAAVWIMATLAGAFVCLASAIVGYSVVLAAERTRAKKATRSSGRGSLGQTPANDFSLWADALHSDLGHIYEPAAATSALTREAEYGWPLIDGPAIANEALR